MRCLPRLLRLRRARIVRNERGVALVFMLIMLGVMTMLGLGITGIGMVATTVTVNAGETANAVAIADAGIAHARRLILWTEWPSLNPFLQNGTGTACDGDELANAPALPLPIGYPATPGDFIPQAGRAFGGGSYQVFVCDDHVTDFDPVTGVLDVDPNSDVNRRILVRSVGVGANGATATVEQVLGSQDVPAVIVNGSVLATGNPMFMGAAGAIHANGNLDVAGNACAQQYFSAVGTVPVSGGSAGGGGACAPSAIEVLPDSPPINVPQVSPDTYRPLATYWFAADGTATINPAAAPTTPPPTGWSFNLATQTWTSSASIPGGTYWVDGNVVIGGSPAPAGGLSLLTRGHVDIGSSPVIPPALSVSGLGPTPVMVSVIAGTDIKLAGSGNTFTGLYYAAHQLDVSGSPTINGQMIALNQADTPYPAAATNLVPLNAAGQMVISGSPNVTYNGGAVQSMRALQWRECRSGANPADPCGPLFGGL